MQPEARVAVHVWDVPVRLFHWVLLLLLVFQFVTGKLGGRYMEWHAVSGYLVFTLIVFRVLWGFVGSTHARFASFLAGPVAAWRFARRLFSRQAVPQVGHNPLGGWMVVALLASLAVQVATGLFANDGGDVEGPLAFLVSVGLSDRLSNVHRWNLDVLLALSALHVLAVLYHWLVKREDLMAAMFTGVKHVPASLLRERRDAARESRPRRTASRENPDAGFAGAARAVATLAAAAAFVLLLLRGPFLA